MRIPPGEEGIAWSFGTLEGLGNPAQTGKKDSGEGPSRGTYLLSKQDTEAIIKGLFKRLSENGAVAGAQGDKTSATIPGQ